MKILIANLGSTSFKYRLFDMEEERQLARGGIDRIGGELSSCFVEIGDLRQERSEQVLDHAAAVKMCLEQLTDPNDGCLSDAAEVAAIGFKAVHGGRYSGVQRVTPDVLDAMEEMNSVAPAHNPPYIRAMRIMSQQLPQIPLIAAFETGFHQTIPPAWKSYGIPTAWSEELYIQRWGFHGASHRFIAQRSAEIIGRNDLRVISCHLGGSSSLCAIKNGESQAATMGMSPQTGLLHNNRCGDFDPFALPIIMRATNQNLEEVLEQLANQSGLLGISGLSGDVRDLEEAASSGNEKAQLAIDVFIADIKRHLGSMTFALGGADAIVFTGGIGENGSQIRSAVCSGLSDLGIELDPALNESAKGEAAIHASSSKTELWVIPTNEELIVARQAQQVLEG